MNRYCTTAVATLVATGSLAALSASASAAITYDGTLSTSEYGSALATSAGGPAPGFGAGHELNALYASFDASSFSFGIAGNLQSGNRIVLFIDSKEGGFNTGNFGRTGSPEGPKNFNSGTTFDVGFEADYALSIGTFDGNYYFDLYTLSGTASSGGGPNNYLGASNDSTADNIGANPANSDATRGFEVQIANTALGYTGGDIQVFALYTGESGYLSNQFLTPAASDAGNYTGGAIDFSQAAPNPITIAVPEPTGLAVLAGVGLLAVGRRRRN